MMHSRFRKWALVGNYLGRDNGQFLFVLVGMIVTAWLAPVSQAQEAKAAAASPPDFTALSLEELMNYPVTSVAGHAEKKSETAAAVHIITQEDIRRSGATSIPEALRMAPGLDVARLDAHTWAISSRGFNDVFANKLLVLQDGRSVYTPLYSGVYWDVQDTLLEDIDRIEVIRGPGATIWGANAVNGVINIITKGAKDTQGWLVSGGAGSEERGFAGARYGVKLADDLFLRVYGKYFYRDDSATPQGASAEDFWMLGRTGFRLDWTPVEQNLVTLQADFYAGKVHQIYTNVVPFPPFSTALRATSDLKGGNILGRWTRTFSEQSEFQLQTYYDRTYRDAEDFLEDRHTFDVDARHRFGIGDRNSLTVGVGYRLSSDHTTATPSIVLSPLDRTTDLFSTFLQDELVLVKDRLRLTLGTKLEHNDYTGFEVQPGARLLWTPTEKQSYWGSISRAVRTPSRAEQDILITQNTPTPGVFATISGNREFESEKLIAYELGHRIQVNPSVSLDTALFFNDYDDLRTVEAQPIVFNPPFVTAPFVAGNKLRGETYGVELSPTWQVNEAWRLQAAYTYLQMQLHLKPGSTDTISEADERRSPRHQISLRSLAELPGNVEFDAALRFVDDLPAIQVKSYVELDLRVGWRPTKNLEFSIAGLNLLHDRHQEFAPSTIRTQTTEVERSVYGKVTWRF
jgi:iron complex outermembrane recepter protein